MQIRDKKKGGKRLKITNKGMEESMNVLEKKSHIRITKTELTEMRTIETW